MKKNLLRAAIAVSAATVAATLPATPASALVVPIPIGVNVYIVAGGFDVCGHGTATSAVNSWTLRVDGARVFDPAAPATESADAPLVTGTVIAASTSSSAAKFNACIFVGYNGAPAGHFQATLVYAGVGTDAAGAMPGFGLWAAGSPTGYGIGIGP